VTGAPDLDGWGLVERLLADLASLEGNLWLVIDDVHELGSSEALRQLELLVMRAPPELLFVLAARHDVRLGLHRLRLEGELAEIRAADLKFTLAEAGQLLAAAGVELPGPVLAALHERTEGWAAGLRLAALALAGHPDPARFAAEFSGTERTVAEYLLAEVLERHSEQVRRLLLRTSVLERVNGELARLLTGDEGAERILQDLEHAGSFVVSLDGERTWFRYHQMFADLLQLELRRAAPGEVTRLHQAAAAWFAGQGFTAEAVRHTQAAGDWGLAARLLADRWPRLHLDCQAGTIHELVAGFPVGLLSADAELAVVAAADELARGSLETAERYLYLAERRSDSVPEARRGQLRLLRGVVSLLLAVQRGNLPGVAVEAQRLAAIAEGGDAALPSLTADLRAVALISLGSTEFWAAGKDAARYLERGLTLARRIGRPYLEFTCLAYQSAVDFYKSFESSAERATAAVELARRHGWSSEPAFGVACLVLASSLIWQGQLDEGEPWVQRAEHTLRAETHPAPRLSILGLRGVLELVRGQDTEALATFRAAEQLARRLVAPHHTLPPTQAMVVHTLVRLGETERAEQVLAALGQQDPEHAEIRIAAAALRLGQDNPGAALAELAPLLDRTTPVYWKNWLTLTYVLEATGARMRQATPRGQAKHRTAPAAHATAGFQGSAMLAGTPSCNRTSRSRPPPRPEMQAQHRTPTGSSLRRRGASSRSRCGG
jgi:LuxR family transcriptional regulator, maltose regulon positive regulatory protein